MLDTVGLAVDDINADLPTRVWTEWDDQTRSTDHGNMKSSSGRRTLSVKHIKSRKRLLVEGSCAAHYQEHNIVSSNDMVMTAFSMLKTVKDWHDIKIPLERAREFARGEGITVTRVDIPVMLRVPQGMSVGAVVNGLACAGIRCGINVALYHNESFYYDQGSQASALKGYDKAAEIEQRKTKLVLPVTETAGMLSELAASNVRLEAVFRQKYLANQSRFAGQDVTPRHLSPTVLAEMFLELIKKYDLRGSLRARLHQEELWQIPQRYRGTVAFWQNGGDMLPYFDHNERTFGRHRKFLREKYSIDIGGLPPSEIEVPAQIGDILAPENFVPVPEAIRRDPQLFHSLNMRNEWNELCDQMRLENGISRVYVDPYEKPHMPHELGAQIL
ncbi:phage/plasmid replication protein, II/X family [Cupriavidus basilensis]|uniref:Phage/plasmid replication protein, II/X family n=1 Tax=Cupriavidus basilensis TaxID=68895 RepID=A0ABT6B0Z5_9BURK|nr:phage/plasmid replication protein, II/X family [Cupriavidus basilensis]MDF3838551.1 phage/plasmid replication protein, II/X family [Cupriavidus basilensis]